MDDPVEIRRRIESLRERLACRGDYGEMLANGHVVRWPEDIAAWRAGIRAQARADRIKVRTGSGGCGAYALLVRRPDDKTGDSESMAALWEMADAAVALRHEPVSVARHRSERLLGCDRCPALGYADSEDHVIGGSLLDTGCPNGEHPRPTALNVM